MKERKKASVEEQKAHQARLEQMQAAQPTETPRVLKSKAKITPTHSVAGASDHQSGSLQEQARLLADTRIDRGQRQLLAAHITRVHGNKHLQRALTASRLFNGSGLEAVQRQKKVPASKKKEPWEAELDRLLTQIKSKKTPKIPAFEAIVATTSGEYSYGEFETAIEKLWRRERISFTAVARKIAKQNISGWRGGPIPRQSPQIKPASPYAKRWSLNLFAMDYPGTTRDLMAINKLTRRGSPFQRAQAAEFQRTRNVRNPNADQITDNITSNIMELFAGLASGQIGELVVFYSGHGGYGGITGVDNKWVTRDRLASLAKLAGDFNVHLVYVLDTCRAGGLAHLGQRAAAWAARARIAGLPRKLQKVARAKYKVIKEFGTLNGQISVYTLAMGDAVRAFYKRPSRAKEREMFFSIAKVSDRVKKLQDSASKGILANSKLAEIDKLKGLASKAWDMLFKALQMRRSDIRRAMRHVAHLLDGAGDILNRLILELDKLTKSAKKS